jgi:hypothetical protein
MHLESPRARAQFVPIHHKNPQTSANVHQKQNPPVQRVLLRYLAAPFCPSYHPADSTTRPPGNKIKAAIPPGRIVDATVKAVLETAKGRKYIVACGNDQSATINERDVVRE